MSTTGSIVPALVGIHVQPIPTMYTGLMAFASPDALYNALQALPALGHPSAGQILQGVTKGPDGSGFCTAVAKIAEEPALADANAFVRDGILPAIEREFMSKPRVNGWSKNIQGEERQRLFGQSSVFGNIEIEVSRVSLESAESSPAEVEGDSAPGVKAQGPRDAYYLGIKEFYGDGVQTSDRVETSLAALLGLHRGIYGIGVGAQLDEAVGFTAAQAASPLAIDLRQYLFALDGIVNTDRVEAGVVASALHMGSSYLDIGNLAPMFGGVVLFGRSRLGVSREVSIPVIFGLRLMNLRPYPINLAQKGWSESGRLLVTKVDPSQKGVVELLILPVAGITFSEVEVEVLHEVAKKCREVLGTIHR